ncbi:hypothetical protein [Brunnivagina elsteri]|uniref:Uncharacterized protein n=1 Tax=Brunnivagina elsteri CCALA 953 TaxID=987040 RepID=A0A2A2TQ97_9CYAN|nr:hypothetical protein [Calothrix elsteri]PAX60620.1 hypothetical protein CK510_00765 [Calothrix elsteri CCALA 953]
MSLSALRKFILPPVIASAAVFAAMSFPLAVLGDKPINIRFEEEPIFDGRLRDIAPPYVVAITALSLGAGIAAAAVSGWRNSSRKSSEFEQQLTQLEEHLEQKDKLLKELNLSESRLQLSGLNNFLDEEVPFDSYVNRNTPPTVVTQPVVAQIPVQTYQQVVNSLPSRASKPLVNQSKVANASSAFASGQSYMTKHGQAQANAKDAQASVTAREFEALQIQLREMMERMQMMQNSLQQQPNAVSNVAIANRFQVHYEAATTDEVKF